MEYTKSFVARVYERIFSKAIISDWTGIDVIFPIIDKIRSEGSIFIIKLDGGRTETVYTCTIFGGRVENEVYIHTDAETIEDGLSYVIGKYAQLYWNIQ